MARPSSFLGLGLVTLLLAAIPGACGGGSGATGGASSKSAGSSSAAGTGGSTGTGGSIGIGSTGSGGSSPLGCSADLHSVVDANGNVVMTCPDDEGCAAGTCVPACQAAAASKGNVGCDFYALTPPSYPPDLPPCFAVFVANLWPEPAALTVTYGGMSYDVTQFGRIPVNGQPESTWPAVPATGLPQDQVAVLFLAHDPMSVFSETGEAMTCPVPPAISQSGSTSIQGSGFTPQSGTGNAFHITSSAPVSAYDILPYGGAHTHFPGATMLMPTSAWGTNYVTIATPVGTAMPTPGPLWGAIVGMTDGTTVQVLPTVDLPVASGFPAASAGMTATYTLSAGQYLEWQLPSTSKDMSGTIVSSNNPVAVVAGNRFFRVQPVTEPGGEEAHGQIPPVSALGNEYVVAPYATRRADLAPESIYYRVVGMVNGTSLTFDPAAPADAGAPMTLAVGQVVDFQVTGPFVVSSQDAQHPFAIAQIMPTANLPGGEPSRPGATAPMYPPNLGDEEFTILLPPGQFLSQYVFFTDPTYPTTNLVLTRVAGPNGFEDVTVGCLGAVGGWQPAGSSGKYEVTNVDLLRAGIASGTCANGRQTAQSSAPFGVVVWGEDSYSSYAYPAGGTAAQLTSVTVPPTPQ